ncbi:MAG: SIR2 family protein [Proteobacteria bacterium]|nr:SIR2 family protein [Pseudomonadota bacterium]
MRNKSKRKKLNRVFVLGAGASYAASQVQSKGDSLSTYEAPLDAHFCQRITSVDLERPYWVADARDKIIRAWRHDTSFVSLGLERAILLHLGNLEFIHAIHPRRLRESIPPHEWMNLISHLTCAILRRCRQNGTKLYTRFSDWAFPVDSDHSIRSRIITFNYDTLLDNLLLKKFKQGDLYFDTLRERRDRVRKHNQNFPVLLKLHGSSNWRCSAKSFRRIIEGSARGNEEDPFEIPEVWLGGRKLPMPDDDVSPLIIPPLPAKPISEIKLFRYLWTRAYEYLYETKEIVIVGYSLPDADQMAYSMFSNFQAERLERVVIVDPDTQVLARWRSVLRRQPRRHSGSAEAAPCCRGSRRLPRRRPGRTG